MENTQSNISQHYSCIKVGSISIDLAASPTLGLRSRPSLFFLTTLQEISCILVACDIVGMLINLIFVLLQSSPESGPHCDSISSVSDTPFLIHLRLLIVVILPFLNTIHQQILPISTLNYIPNPSILSCHTCHHITPDLYTTLSSTSNPF